MDMISTSRQRGEASVSTKSWRKIFVYTSTLLGLLNAPGAMAADDNSTLGVVSDMIGITTNKSMEKIDYSERPKLVMPPRQNALPAPRERQQPEGWPIDADSGVRRTDRFARHPNAPPEKPKPTLLEHINGPHRKQQDAPRTEETTENGILGSIMNLRANRARLNEDEGPVPSRNLLSEPPDGLRTPTQDLDKVKDSEKKDSLWNFFGNPVEIAGAEKKPDTNKAQSANASKQPVNKNTPVAQPASEEKAGLFSRMSDMISGH